MASIGATAPTDPSRRRTAWWRAAALTALAALTVAALPASAPADARDDVRVNVQVASGSLAATAQLLAARGDTVTARLDTLDTLVVDVADGRVDAIGRLPGVVSAVPDGQVQLTSPPRASRTAVPDANATSGRGRKLGLDFEGAYADPAPGVGLDHVAQAIGADDLWARGTTGRGVGVALLDSGVVPVPGLTAGNVRNGPDLSFESQIEALAHLDTYGHGTHMAGIIAGNDAPARNAVGGFDLAEVAGSHLGIAPDANLLSLKLATFDGATDVSQVLAAIDWVVQHKDDEGLNIRVLNLSFGTDGAQDYRHDPLAYAVEVAWRHGIVVVVSAGNDGDGYGRLANPAVNPFVLAVGAADTNHTLLPADDTVTDFSNRGDGVRNPDLVAPGRSVLSLRSPNSYIDVNNPQADVPARYLKGSGTSQSAAVVSGAVALLLQARPELSPDEVKYLLTSSAMPIKGTAVEAGAGLVAVDRASRAGIRGNGVIQAHESGTGTGSLEASRGSMYLGEGEDALVGEQTILGDFDAATWAPLSLAGRTWRDGTWLGQEWTDACWCGDSWTGRTWRGLTWRADTWAGRTWRTDLWDGRTWRDSGWDGRTWRDAGWFGRTWRSEDWDS
ncbi:MAG TPA: S8 family serine peptidase [Egicoccus sp.]|nr:S8 family serine peptidase [Egicoccus sp.]HSK25043.1 S8 family serine peptidase [Egicoccus sp.]